MTTEIDVLNTSWETFQRAINNHQTYSSPDLDNMLVSSRLPSFQELFDYKTYVEKSSEEDSSPIFEEYYYSPELFICENNIQNQMMDEIPIIETPISRNVNMPRIKREKKPEFARPETIEVKIPRIQQKSIVKLETTQPPAILSKKNVTKTSKKGDNVRVIWWNNLGQIISNTMIPLRRCLYKFENPSNCPWKGNEGLYIFEIHLLQILCPKEAWNFKRYVDNHSKKAGEGQTFTLCSSIHKEEWEGLEMKSNKFFKKARMININAFKEKNGFITKGKWKYIFEIFQTQFENLVVYTSNNRSK